MPYPMTRLRVRVGEKEFNFHSVTPCLVLRPCLCKDRLSLYLEDDFELYRHPKGQTRDADNEPNRYFLVAEYIAKKIRYCIRHLGLIKEISKGGDEYADSHYAHHSVERSQALFCSGQSA